MWRWYAIWLLWAWMSGAGWGQTTAAAAYKNQAKTAIRQQDYQAAVYYFQQEEKILAAAGGGADWLKSLYNIAELYRGMTQYDSAQLWAQRCNQAHIQYYGAQTAETLDAGLLLAQVLYLSKQYDAAFQQVNHLEQQSKTATNFNNGWKSKHRVLAASLQVEMGDYSTALQLYESALHTAGTDSDLQARIYHNMAALKTNERRWLEALSFYDKAQQLRESTLGKSHPNTAFIYENKSVLYLGMGDPQAAIAWGQRALTVYQAHYPIAHPNIASTYLNLSNAYKSLTQSDSAIYWVDKAIAIYRQLFPKGSSEEAYALLCAARLAAPHQAISLYQSSIAMQGRLGREEVPDVGIAYSEWGALLQQKGQWQSALRLYRMAIEAQVLGEQPVFAADAVAWWALPDSTHIQERVFYRESFLQLLHQYIRCLLGLYQQQPEWKHLKAIQDWLQMAMQLGMRWKNRQWHHYDQQGYLTCIVDIAETGLWVCAETKRAFPQQLSTSNAWMWMEQNKSLQMLEVWALSGQAQRRDLWYKEQLYLQYKHSGQGETPPARAILSQIFALQQAIPAAPPTPIRDSTDRIAQDWVQVRQLLADSQAVVSYFWGKTHLYRLWITSDQANFEQLPLPDSMLLQEFIDRCAGKIMDKGHWQADIARFAQLGHHLYRQLIPNAIQARQLVIIPDGDLVRLPYEILLISPSLATDYAELPYLLHRYSISYAYSMRVWAAQTHKTASQTLAPLQIWAATGAEEGQLLTWNRRELDYLQAHWAGQYHIAVSEAVFKQEVARYGVLHLAVHGWSTSQKTQNVGLQLAAGGGEDGGLRSEEVATLPLTAQMVVLNACETGLGNWRQGEGAMSMARAFMYTGCPSIVFSLWQINDQSSADIITHFYAYLGRGYAKDAALRQAKLDMLTQSGGLMAHPVHWAGLIQAGSSSTVALQAQQKGGHWQCWLGGGVVLIMIIGLGSKWKRK